MQKRTAWMYKLCLTLITCISSIGSAHEEYNSEFVTEEYSTGSCYNKYVNLELLYWNSHEDGLQFAANGFNTEGESGRHTDLNWQWRPGFRIGVGAIFGCNQWDLSLNYTWFRNRAHNSVFDPEENTLGTWAQGAGTFTNLSGDLHLIYQTLDLTLKKAFCVTECFIVEPVVALRGAFIKERYNIEYFNSPEEFEEIINTQKFHAIGPLGGINTRWKICNHLSLIAEGAISLLYGHYAVGRFSEVANDDIRSSFNTLRSVVQGRFGFGWEKCLSFGYVDIQLLWEQQKWINHNQMLFGPMNFDAFVQNRNTDLSLYGFTLKAQLSF